MEGGGGEGGFVHVALIEICLCVLVYELCATMGTPRGFSSTPSDGCRRWRGGAEGGEVRSRCEGSVSMATPLPSPPPRTSTKQSPVNKCPSFGALGGGWSWEGERSRRRGLIGFLDNP